MFQRILVPLDGSTASFHALDQALQIALHDQAVVTALYVIDARVLSEARVYLPMQSGMKVSDDIVPPSQASSTYQAWALQVTARARARGEAADVEVRPEIVTGIPYQEISARTSKYDLLVMGTWDTWRAYPGPFLAGNTLQHVLARTRLPTLYAPGEAKTVKTILVAYDDSRASRDALQLAATWSQARSLRLIVLTVQQEGNRAQTLLQKARTYAHPAVPRPVAREGDPATAILAIAQEHDCDLIAAGANAGRSRLRRSEGGVVNTLLRSSNLPVLLSH